MCSIGRALRLAPPFAPASASAFAAAAASACRGASQVAAAAAAATDVSNAAAAADAAAADAVVADAAGRIDAQQQPVARRHRDRAQVGRAQQLRRPPLAGTEQLDAARGRVEAQLGPVERDGAAPRRPLPAADCDERAQPAAHLGWG